MSAETDNIEEFLRNLTDRKKRKFISVAVIALIVIVAANSLFYSIGAESVGVIQRFGQFVRTTQPGLHLKMPFGIETVTKVPVTRILSQEFGFRTTKPGIRTVRSNQSLLDESLMLTGDLNVVVVDWIIQYKIKDPREYLYLI